MSERIHSAMSLIWAFVGVGACMTFGMVSAKASALGSRGETIHALPLLAFTVLARSALVTGPMTKSLAANLSSVTGIVPPATS